ncbi:MAG: hypothetical protein V2A73_05465 [Pseudomonadota bacterium]
MAWTRTLELAYWPGHWYERFYVYLDNTWRPRWRFCSTCGQAHEVIRENVVCRADGLYRAGMYMGCTSHDGHVQLNIDPSTERRGFRRVDLVTREDLDARWREIREIVAELVVNETYRNFDSAGETAVEQAETLSKESGWFIGRRKR